MGGQWVDSTTGETFPVRNPSDSDEVVGRFQLSGAADADNAVEAATAAVSEWSTTPGPERGAILHRVTEDLKARTDDMAEALTREEGMTLAESQPEVQRSVDIFAYHAEQARDFCGEIKPPSAKNKRLFTLWESMGVAALVTPWNDPIANPAW